MRLNQRGSFVIVLALIVIIVASMVFVAIHAVKYGTQVQEARTIQRSFEAETY